MGGVGGPRGVQAAEADLVGGGGDCVGVGVDEYRGV